MKPPKIILTFILLFVLSGTAFTQGVAINTVGADPDDSAILDISANNKGVLIPRISEVDKNTTIMSPEAGLIIYNTTSKQINIFNGTHWQHIPDVFASNTIAGGSGQVMGVAVNVIASEPHHSSIFDVYSESKGFLLPRNTEAGIYATPPNGLIFYNTDNIRMGFYDGSSWQYLCSIGSDIAAIGVQNGQGVLIKNDAAVNTHHSALLELSSNNKGLLIPRLTSVQRDLLPSPAEGLLIYNSDENRIEFFNNTEWRYLVFGNVPDPSSAITGTTPVCRSQNGVAYSVTNVPGITYTWTYTGSGATFATGQGTNSVTVNFSSTATSGNITVTPSNACGEGIAATFSVTVKSLPATPIKGLITSTETEVTFSWNPWTANDGYMVNTVNESLTATDLGPHLGGTTYHTLTGLSPCTEHTLYIWAYNDCGISNPLILRECTKGCCEGTSSVTFTYRGSSVTYGTVDNYCNCWLDRNLGASQVATSSTDASAYGDLFQWGRGDDGHQIRTSGTTTTLASTDNPGHANFIIVSASPWHWRNPFNASLWQGVSGVNNPCPPGWRIPTSSDWTTSYTNWIGGYHSMFDGPLKLPAAGYRSSSGDLLFGGGSWPEGHYWSNDLQSLGSDWHPKYFLFRINSQSMSYTSSRVGKSVRCIKD